MTAFSIQAGGLGVLASLFFYGYTPMQIPAGMLYDRFGPRVLLTITLALCALATFTFGLTQHFSIASFCRFLMGLTAAFGFAGALVVGAAWFPIRYFAAYTGMVQVLGCIGAILGQGPIASLTAVIGWRACAIAIAILGLIFAIGMWIIIRDYPPDHPHHHTPVKKVFAPRPVFQKTQNWWIAVYGFGIWAPVVIFAILWGVPFFHDVYHISLIKAASLTSFVWIGIAIGGPALGWWSYRISRRLVPMITAAALGVISSVILIYVPNLSYPLIILLLIIFGIAASAQAMSFGILHDINQRRNMGTAIGLVNMAVVGAGLVFQPLVGFILQYLGSSSVIDGSPVYSVTSYYLALSLAPISFLLAFLVCFLIKETYCRQIEEL